MGTRILVHNMGFCPPPLEDFQKLRLPKTKTTKNKVNQKRKPPKQRQPKQRRPKTKMTINKDDP